MENNRMTGSKPWQRGAALAVVATLAAATPAASAGTYDYVKQKLQPLAKAMVNEVEGSVNTKLKSESKWAPAQIGASLGGGDSIQTGQGNSSASLGFRDGTLLRIARATTVTMRDEQQRGLNLFFGKIWAKVIPRTGGLKVQTPAAIAAVVGTELAVNVDERSKSTTVEVTHGIVDVTSTAGGKQVRVAAGMFTTVPMGGVPTVPKPLKYLQNSAFREIQPRVALRGPAEGATLQGSHEVGLEVNPGNRKINFLVVSVDGEARFLVNKPPYRIRLDTTTLSNGRHTLQAIADLDDRNVYSKKVTFQVMNPSAIPSPSIEPPGIEE